MKKKHIHVSSFPSLWWFALECAKANAIFKASPAFGDIPLLLCSKAKTHTHTHTHTHTVCSYKIHGQKAACVFVRVFRLRRTENRNKIEKCEPLLVRGGGEKLVAAICWRNGDSGRRNSLAGGWNSLIGWRDKATSLELALGRPAK